MWQMSDEVITDGVGRIDFSKGLNTAAKLHLIRGLPGAGKSTHANKLMYFYNRKHTTGKGAVVIEADQYFVDAAGVYKFDPSKIADAHADCQRRVREALADGKTVFVANTFTRQWEADAYFRIAEELNIPVVAVYTVYCDVDKAFARQLHGVPRHAHEAMHQRFQDTWEWHKY